MQKWEFLELHQFLASKPKMRLTSYDDNGVTIEGEYDVHAQMEGFNAIHDTYSLKLHFPKWYPREIPTVLEVGHRIKRDSDHHTYGDGSFCLGSEINIKAILSEAATISDFVDRVLSPFLYSISYKLKYGIFPYGDLAHGEAGLIDDYEKLFQIQGKKSVIGVLNVLGKRKRVANKLACPCCCGRRLGKCDYRFNLEEWRHLDKRRWFREHLLSKFTPLERIKPKKKTRKKRG